jgi:hypothetical protein
MSFKLVSTFFNLNSAFCYFCNDIKNNQLQTSFCKRHVKKHGNRLREHLENTNLGMRDATFMQKC